MKKAWDIYNYELDLNKKIYHVYIAKLIMYTMVKHRFDHFTQSFSIW